MKYSKKQKGKAKLPNGMTFDFEINDIINECLVLKFTSGEQKGKYSFIEIALIDNTLTFY